MAGKRRGGSFLLSLIINLLLDLSWSIPAWICLVLGVAAGTACTVSWLRVHRVSAIICIGVTMWFIYLALCHLVVILHN